MEKLPTAVTITGEDGLEKSANTPVPTGDSSGGTSYIEFTPPPYLTRLDREKHSIVVNTSVGSDFLVTPIPGGRLVPVIDFRESQRSATMETELTTYLAGLADNIANPYRDYFERMIPAVMPPQKQKGIFRRSKVFEGAVYAASRRESIAHGDTKIEYRTKATFASEKNWTHLRRVDVDMYQDNGHDGYNQHYGSGPKLEIYFTDDRISQISLGTYDSGRPVTKLLAGQSLLGDVLTQGFKSYDRRTDVDSVTIRLGKRMGIAIARVMTGGPSFSWEPSQGVFRRVKRDGDHASLERKDFSPSDFLQLLRDVLALYHPAIAEDNRQRAKMRSIDELVSEIDPNLDPIQQMTALMKSIGENGFK